jgi:predicted nucleotidyltransferase
LGTLPALETATLPSRAEATAATALPAPAPALLFKTRAPIGALNSADRSERTAEKPKDETRPATKDGVSSRNRADDDFPATVSENSPEARKRRGPAARDQLETLSKEVDPGKAWDNASRRSESEPIRVVGADKGRVSAFWTYKRLQLSVANFYLGNRLRKQYELLEDARDANRIAPSAVNDQAGLFIEARTKGLAGRVYPLGLDILDRPSLVEDAHLLFQKFFDADPAAREAWEAYVAAALESPRSKIPSQLKKALFVVLQDAAGVPKEELAAFFDARREGLRARGDQFLSLQAQERVIAKLKAAVTIAVTEINATLAPGRRLVGISLLGSYVTRTARPDSDLDFHVISEDAGEASRAAFVARLSEIWEAWGRAEELGAFQYALPSHARLVAKVYEKPGNLPYRVLSPYAETEAALTAERGAARWSGAKKDFYARIFELSFRSAARLRFLWWDFKRWIANNVRAAYIYHGLQFQSLRFFFGTRAAGLRTKEAKWSAEIAERGIEPAVKDLRGLLLHWRAEAYTGAIRPLGPQVADRRAVKEAGMRTWDRYYPKNPEARAAFVRYIERVERVAPPGRPSYFRKQVFQVFYETLKLSEEELVAHIDAMLDASAVEEKIAYGRTMKPRAQKTFEAAALRAIAEANEQVPHDSEVVAVVLLGSYATGTPGAKSDFDYMVVTRDGSKTALKPFVEAMKAVWEGTEFKDSPLGPFQYAVPPSRRLLELTHPEGYLVYSDESGVAARLSNPVPPNVEPDYPGWKRVRGRVFAEFWKAYLRVIYASLDFKDRVLPARDS